MERKRDIYIPKVTGKIDISKLFSRSESRLDKQSSQGRYVSDNRGRKEFDTPKSESDNIKDIWKLHTSVQEQLLNARAVPIRIISDSIKIAGDKMILSVDERNSTNSVLTRISDLFQIPFGELNVALEKGFFLSDIEVARKVDSSEKQCIVEIAEQNYIKFSSNPIIDGVIKQRNSSFRYLSKILNENNIEHKFDKNNRLQIPIPDLVQIEEQLNNKGINISDNTNIIFPIRPSINFLSGGISYTSIEDNMYFEADKNTNEFKLIVKNGFLCDSFLHILNEKIGLRLNRYVYTFCVDKQVYLKSHFNEDAYSISKFENEDKCLFPCTTYIESSKRESDFNGCFEEQFDFSFKFTRLKRLFDRHFGKDNVSYTIKFEYDFNQDCFWTKLYNDLKDRCIGISSDTNTIGIDFNRKQEQITEILSFVTEKCPYIALSYFPNHKCNVDFSVQNVSLKELEKTLHNGFPSIQTERNDKDGTLHFIQEYTDSIQYNRIKDCIKRELDSLNLAQYTYELSDNPAGKEKYCLKLDSVSLQESLSDSIKDLRGSDFKVGDADLGKLIKVNYPQLTFDISLSDKEIISSLIENNQIKTITPNLTGDLEKIARLKKSFEAIIDKSGRRLQNPNLSEFIFDASKAKPIDDIDMYLDNNDVFYKDIDSNLLNKKINESQKQAIIKTLKAEDLALIQGPPGTGKSTAIAEIIWQHIRLNPQERILLTSETNLAVDNAIDRVVNSSHNLVKPIRIADEEKLESEGRQFNLEVMKQWVVSGKLSEEIDDNDTDEEDAVSQKVILQNWMDNIRRRINKYQLSESVYKLWNQMLSEPSKETRQLFFDVYKRNCNVVGATCSSIGDRNTKGKPTGFYRSYCGLFGNQDISFDTVIQDESSKATPAELSLPLIYGKKNIIIGDHRQLPPLLDKEEFISSLNFLLDRTDDKQERKNIVKLKNYVLKHFSEMEISHFQRLFENIDDSLKGVFNRQFRMHPAINEVIKQFYIEDGGLTCGLDPAQVDVPDFTNPQSRYHGLEIEGFISPSDHVLWIDTRTPELQDGFSRVNYGEVEAIRKVLSKFDNSESFQNYLSHWDSLEDKQIGLISFYGKQIKLLLNVRREFKNIPIRVSTVDRFQGMERNIIIVSMVRSNCIATDIDQRPDYELYGALGYPEQNDLGFAQSPNRLNVALSRAKRLLIIVGNSELFRTKDIYNNVYECIEKNQNGRIIKYDEL